MSSGEWDYQGEGKLHKKDKEAGANKNGTGTGIEKYAGSGKF